MNLNQPPDEGAGATDLNALGMAAHLAGDHDQAVRTLQQAYQHHLDDGSLEGAVRSAFLLGMIFGTTNQQSLLNGWLGRAQRVLAELPADARDESPVGRGYVAVLELHRSLGAGEFEQVGALATEVSAIGAAHRDANLLSLGLVSQGRFAIYGGAVHEGLTLLDEAMAGVLAGEPDGFTSGLVFCTAIEGCQEIGAVDRMSQWTSGLLTWCEGQPWVSAFAGPCALHHGQVLTLRGSWVEAVAEFTASTQRYDRQGQPLAAGFAERERGDLLRLRGDLASAEEAYRNAATHGCDPQPGLAQLWLGQGRSEAAVSAVRRCLAETGIPARRISLLPAAIEVMAGTGALDEARALTEELDDLARLTDCDPVLAAAAFAHATLELAQGDAAGALPYARKAAQLWGGVGSPFEAARSRVVIGRALTDLGDHASARRELETTRATFESLGAEPSVAALDALLVSAGGASPAGLTGRELEVLRLLAAGHSNRVIATDLFLAEKTVARHLSNIYTKLGVDSRTAAAAYAHAHGLA